MKPIYSIIIAITAAVILISLGIRLVQATGIIVFGEDILFPCISVPNPFRGRVRQGQEEDPVGGV